MEHKTPEALDDIRKKRLAYFTTSVKQPPSENIQNNASEVVTTQHHDKELADSRGGQSYERDNRNETIEQLKYRKKNNVEQDTILGESAEPLSNNKVEVEKYGKDKHGKDDDIKRTSGAKSDYIEGKAKSNLKTSSFFFSANGTENDNDFIGKNAGRNVGYYEDEQAEAKEAIKSLDKNETRDPKRVHYEDGYNETVERLIKATKEELLGKQVEDDIWSKYRKEQTDNTVKPLNRNLDVRRDSEPVIQDAPVYSHLEPRRHSVIVNSAQNQTSGTVDNIFQSSQAQGAVQPNMSVNESHQTFNIDINQSGDLSDLGLSTHRPEIGTEVKELTIETHGINLNESLTRQLRYALGEDKFKEFVEKSRKDIDVLQQERVSARSEKGKQKPSKNVDKDEKVFNDTKTDIKPTSVPTEETPKVTTVKEDYTPRNDGDAVHDLIGEHVLKKREPRQKLTSNPAYRQKSVDTAESLDSAKATVPKKGFVPELNLSGVNTSPRPLLNRPKHEPFNIYQEKTKQSDKKIENRVEPKDTLVSSVAKNYEQVTVSRNVMYSADEIYFQAYGKYPQHQKEPQESSHGAQVARQVAQEMVKSQGANAVPKGVLVNQQGIAVSAHDIQMAHHAVPMSPHAMSMTPHGIHHVPSSAATQQYPPNFKSAEMMPVSIHSAMPPQKPYNVPPPPHFINGHFTTVPDSRAMVGFAPTPPQSPLFSGSIQMPHPPSQPPPTYVQSQQTPTHSTNISAPTTPHYVMPTTPHFATVPYPPDQKWMPPTHGDQTGYPRPQGIPHPGYSVAYPYPYPVMMIPPHPPPAEPIPPSDVSDKAEDKHTVTDKVEEETTFTSVSQIKPPEEARLPHPPASKKEGKKRSPRKMAMADRAANRHIESIRQHHEQRRQEQGEQLTEAEIVEKQRKFAKASIDRYFQSLENLYQPAPKLNLDDISDVLSDSSEENGPQYTQMKLNEIPEAGVNENELSNNDKLNEIFKKTNPDNFDIAKMKSELEIQNERLNKLEMSMSVEEFNKLGQGIDDDNKLAQMLGEGQIDTQKEMIIEIEQHKPVLESNKDIQKTHVQSVPTKHDIVVAPVDMRSSEFDSKENEKKWDYETLANTAVTGFTIDAGGVTERLEELGLDPKYVKGELNNNDNDKNNQNKQDGQSAKKGKLLIICPECDGFNKEYMSWCTHCGEMIIGVEPMLVSKNRQGKIRTKPLTETVDGKETADKTSFDVAEKVERLNKVNNTQCKTDQNDEFEKPFKLDLGLIKSPRETTDTKLNVSPNKSDGKDSGRPSSEDQDLLHNRNKIEQEVEDDICETITDPIVKDYVKSHFAKKRQLAMENKLLPAGENMKSKVQSWIEEVGIGESQQAIVPTHEKAQAGSESKGKEYYSYEMDNHRVISAQNDDKTAQNVILPTHSVHLENNRTLKESGINALHLEKGSSHVLLTEDPALVPPEIPKFGADSSEDVPFDPAELNLKLVTDSMDFSQFGSVDFSHAESVNFDKNIDKKTVPNEKGDAEKARARQERRNKRGHGAIDVEVFGYEESRECKNSSRGQRLVPVLNLPLGSSDEDDASDQDEITENYDVENDNLTEVTADFQGTFEEKNDKVSYKPEHGKEKKVDSFGDASVEQQYSKDITMNQIRQSEIQDLKQDVSVGKKDSVAVSETDNYNFVTSAWESENTIQRPGPSGIHREMNERGDAHPIPSLIRPEESTEEWQLLFDPTLAEDDQQEETTRLEEMETDRDQQPFLMQLIDSKKGGKGKRPKSSKGKPVKSKVRQSIEKPGYQRKWARSSTAWSSYNPGELNTSSSMRVSTDVQGQGSDRSEGHDLEVTSGNLSERSVSPARPSGIKARPASADVYKRKPQKSRPTSAGLVRKSRDPCRGKKDKDEDLYNMVEHRLPRMGIQELLQEKKRPNKIKEDRLASPRSTYDKYLQMTPRINEGTVSCWQCLPDEILIHIFAYLSQADLTHCAQVCHQFYRVAMDESLWKYITIKKKSDLDDSCLEEISKRHPVSLALIHCHGDQITAKGLRDMFRECADSLKELNMSRCSRGALSGDSILLHAAARCHNITHIDTSWCNVTDSGLMAISNTCNRLESLCINGCQAISNDGLETIIKKHGASLRVLEMFGCFNITPRGLQAVSNNCINLISLHLGQCYKLTDSSIAQLSSSLGRVETLDLRGCKQLKDNCIRRVVKNCTRLKNLSLANCPNITDVSVLEISTYLTDIRSVDLCGCKNITDSSIRALVNTCTNLRHIDISSTGCTHRSVSMIANFCAQRLESLRINFLSDVTEASLIKLAKHCRRLTSVHLYGCPSVKNLDKIKEENPTFTIEM